MFNWFYTLFVAVVVPSGFFIGGYYMGTYKQKEITYLNNGIALKGCEITASQCLEEVMQAEWQVKKYKYYLEQCSEIVNELKK